LTLVGDENRHKPLHYYRKELLSFKRKQIDMGLDIPFLFHAGETLGDGDEPDSNLFDALVMGTKRIGHG
jgi:adenosine deaminase CECR1